MENGLQEFAELTAATTVVGKDKDVVQVLSVEVGDDLKDTTMIDVVEEKVQGGVAEGEGGEEEEDVYSMEVNDELGKGNGVVAREVEPTVVAVAPPELDMNDDSTKEEDVTMSTINDEPSSESGAATERGPVEIPAVEPAAGAAAAAAASEKEDVTDLNETPKSELENESEEMRVNEASPTSPTQGLAEATEEVEVPQESPAKSEAVKEEAVERVIRVAVDVNEPPEASKMVEDVHSDVAPLCSVSAEETKVVHDVEVKMVNAAACVANEAMEGADGDLSGAAQGEEEEEEEAATVKMEPKEEEQSSDQADDNRWSQSQPQGGVDMAVDAKEGDAGVEAEAEKTELEREMELFEASEREEQGWLLAPTRVEQECEEPSRDVQNDRKRALDTPTQERQRKQSRRTQAAEERKKDEEDVCFICFDGGDLVMCDRRSCPKAYHLSCIGRDAAFFKKKGAWLCGWHFCSVCTKPGSFQCFTCPTAYCGSCIQEAEFLMLRKRKGLCEDCLPIVSMIERNETINADGVEVDFEDQDTYECLFKEYWEDLKRRLSLMMPELDKDGKPVGGSGSMLNSGGSETEDHSENEESEKESDESEHELEDEQENPEPVEGARKGRGKGRKGRMGSEKMEEGVEQEEGEGGEEEGEEGEEGGEEGRDGEEVQEQQEEDRGDKFESWASQELLDFIEHMKEDPAKPLSRFAVNKLLWSYIKRHRLQDARKSSQINCDERLRSIFGKESVGQFEMFKHLQAHFPSRSSVDSKKSKDGGKGDEVGTEDEAVGAEGGEDVVGNAKERRRGRRAADEKFERPSSSEYAAITPKNISLIYLRRALLRDLLDDPEFDNKVVDTFVRIRVPGISTKTETTYRLVLVTGTRIGEESYKAGTKTTNIVLEILNLQKKEDVTVDLVSNQDFTEEECQRLRQSIKCGFIKALTVGQVEEKALALQEARVNDWFENERQRLINLRDRASEQGRKKELRECVEKLQELSSPAFRAAKLQARPEVSADPHMDPGYESDVNEMSPLQGGGRMFRAKGAASSRWEKGSGSGGGGSLEGLNLEESSLYAGRKGDADGQRSKSSWEETSRSRGYGRGGYDAGRSSEKVGAGRESSYGVEAKTYVGDERDRRVWDKDWDREQTREQERGRGDTYTWSSSGGRNGLDAWGGEVGEAKYGRGEGRTGTTPVFGQGRTEWGSTRREGIATASLVSTPVGFAPSAPSIQNLAALEKEKLWHYQDPTGTVQGPFTMEQLRKWNTTGLFPVTLTIWKTGQSQAESMLLTEALAGRFKEEIWGGGAGGGVRSRSRELVAGGSPTPRASSAWSVMDAGLGASRGEVGASVGGAEWESRDAGERGGSWARLASSSFGGVPSSSGRAGEEWSGARARVEPESWGGSSRKGDGSSWGGSESGKSTYGRSNSSREYEGTAVREGSRSSRGPRGSKKDVPCRFYAKGYCKRGDACEFWHG